MTATAEASASTRTVRPTGRMGAGIAMTRGMAGTARGIAVTTAATRVGIKFRRTIVNIKDLPS